MPANENRLGRRAPGEWTEFEVQLAISLICRKVHMEKPPKQRGERNIQYGCIYFTSTSDSSP